MPSSRIGAIRPSIWTQIVTKTSRPPRVTGATASVPWTSAFDTASPPACLAGRAGINTKKANAAVIGEALRDLGTGAAGMSGNGDPPPDPQRGAPAHRDAWE